ncbi:hypothetical protein JRC42_19575 [Escherichia albertii]|uniref:hypothetical protein n=1 Tax=Escherichia albertii TaxID=208962 RepID=UPI001958922D|nr:hypothetical protein [Escherichia albertii]QST27740.1 hypothetical protein JRC42_19575 [Escherichia albertii]QST37107.1 hypothetical protein JRC46_19575 [Escherichia albertii]
MKIFCFRYMPDGLLLVSICVLLTWWMPDGIDVHLIAAVVACLSAMLLGAVMVARVLLVILSERVLVTNMIKTGHYRRLVNNLFRAGAALFLLLVLSLFCLVATGQALSYLFYLAVWVAVPAFVWCLKSGWQFYNVIAVLEYDRQRRLLRESFFSLTQQEHHRNGL